MDLSLLPASSSCSCLLDLPVANFSHDMSAAEVWFAVLFYSLSPRAGVLWVLASTGSSLVTAFRKRELGTAQTFSRYPGNVLLVTASLTGQEQGKYSMKKEMFLFLTSYHSQ